MTPTAARPLMRLGRLLLLIAGVGVVGYMVWQIGPGAVWESLRALSWWLVLVICFPYALSTTLDTLKHLEGHRAHIAHSQYHAYGGDGWDTMCSKTAELSEYFNAHPGITTDAGAVLFGDTVTITADGPWQHLLYKLTGRKWGNLDVENETG